MKKTTLYLLIFITFFNSFDGFSQTKKIFHKSHSGSVGSLFMDEKNDFGPGMAPVRYSTPESSIKLNYVISRTNYYPIVSLDTSGNTMRFFDIKDSLIGCDRDYDEYLTHGNMVYDAVSNQFWVYQNYFYVNETQQITTKRWIMISDSIDMWASNLG